MLLSRLKSEMAVFLLVPQRHSLSPVLFWSFCLVIFKFGGLLINELAPDTNTHPEGSLPQIYLATVWNRDHEP